MAKMLWHAHTMSWVPLCYEEAGSSRQYFPPLAFSTNSPLDLRVQISFAVHQLGARTAIYARLDKSEPRRRFKSW